jgi:hypothetical protein
MNIKTGLLGATITGALLLMASCGGSSDSNSSGGGSTSGGSGGSATAGSSSSAGKSSGTGGTASSNGGTSSNSGGTTNNRGGAQAFGGFMFGGNFSFGGAGFDPSDFVCDPKPTAGAACTAGTQPCVDGTDVCYCQAEKWACIDVAAAGEGGAGPTSIGQIECPVEPPMTGDACVGFGACQYGAMQGCACFGTTWMCN